MSQKNEYDFLNQLKILILEMLTNPCEEMVTKSLLHSVIGELIAVVGFHCEKAILLKL